MAPKVTLYILSWCGYCHAAKRLLNKKSVEYDVIDATGDEEIRAWLQSTTGSSTLPQTFIDDRPVGGYTELVALDKSGELDALLAGPSS